MTDVLKNGLVGNGHAEDGQIQELIRNVPAGSTIYFPATSGGYAFKEPIVIDKSLTIRGDGVATVISSWVPLDYLFKIHPQNNEQITIHIEDLKIIGRDGYSCMSISGAIHPSGAISGGSGVTAQSSLRNIHIENFSNDGIVFSQEKGTLFVKDIIVSASNYAFYGESWGDYNQFYVENSLFQGATVGLYFSGAANSSGSVAFVNVTHVDEGDGFVFNNVTYTLQSPTYINVGVNVTNSGSTQASSLTAHAATHQSGGADQIVFTSLNSQGVQQGEVAVSNGDGTWTTLLTSSLTADTSVDPADFRPFSASMLLHTGAMLAHTGAMFSVTASYYESSASFATVSASYSHASASFATARDDLDTHILDTGNPHATDIGNLDPGTLAELNAVISDANLISQATHEAFTSSTNAATSSLQDATASLQSATASLQSVTASLFEATASLQSATGSLFSETGSLRAATGSLFDMSASYALFSASHGALHLSGAPDALNAQDLGGAGLATNVVLVSDGLGGWKTVASESVGPPGGAGVSEGTFNPFSQSMKDFSASVQSVTASLFEATASLQGATGSLYTETGSLRTATGSLFESSASFSSDIDTLFNASSSYALFSASHSALHLSGGADQISAQSLAGDGLAGDVVMVSDGSGGWKTVASASMIDNHLRGGLTGGVAYVDFISASNPTWFEGRVFYDYTEKALAIYNDESEVTHQLGQEFFVRVYNGTGVTITNGQVVYVSGSETTENRPTVAPARADFRGTAGAYGVATHDIENATFGYITTEGIANDVDTSAFSPGEELFLSDTTAGAFTNVAPPTGSIIVPIGWCIRSHATEGKVAIHIEDNVRASRTYELINYNTIHPIDVEVTTSVGNDIVANVSDASGRSEITFVVDNAEYLLSSPASINLSGGTATTPQQNYVFVRESAGSLILDLNTTGFLPDTARIAKILVQDEPTVEASGVLGLHIYNDDPNKHIQHIGDRTRVSHAEWDSGVAPTLQIVSDSTPDDVWISTTAGKAYQAHIHDIPAFNMSGAVGVGTPAYVVNDPTTPWKSVYNLNGLLTDSAGGDMSGGYFALVFFVVINQDSDESKLCVNLPGGSYGNESSLTADASRYADFSIPAALKGNAFLVAEVQLRHQAAGGGTWTEVNTIDLRGLQPNVSAGGDTALGNEFADATFRVFDDTDTTKQLAFEVANVSTATTRTMTVADENFSFVGLNSFSSSITSSVNLLVHGSASYALFSASHSALHLSGAPDQISAQNLAGDGLAVDRILITDGAGGWTTITSESAAPVKSVHGRIGDVASVEGDYSTSQIDFSGVVGAPTFTTFGSILDAVWSPGIIVGGEITDDGDGTVTVNSGSGLLRALNNDREDLYSLDWGVTPITPTNLDTTYIHVEYNGGTPQVVGSIVERQDFNTSSILGTVYRSGSSLHITPRKQILNNFSDKLERRLFGVNGFSHESGLAVSEAGTRNIAITEGYAWLGLNRQNILNGGFDSTGADEFATFYRDGGGGWTEVAESQISNSLYDDGTGTLASLGSNRYGVHWIYIAIDSDVYHVYGQGNYTATQASDALPPSTLPPHIDSQHAVLAAKIIIQQGGTNFSEIVSAFEKLFLAAGLADHGDLAGLTDDDHTQYLLRTDHGLFSASIMSTTASLQAATGSLFSETGSLRAATGSLFDASASFEAHRNNTANPHATDIGNLGAGTLAELNAAISDANVISQATFEAFTSSTNAATSSLQSVTASLFSATASLQAATGSLYTETGSLRTATGSLFNMSASYALFSASHGALHLSGAPDQLSAQSLAGDGLAVNLLMISDGNGGWTTVASQSVGTPPGVPGAHSASHYSGSSDPLNAQDLGALGVAEHSLLIAGPNGNWTTVDSGSMMDNHRLKVVTWSGTALTMSNSDHLTIYRMTAATPIVWITASLQPGTVTKFIRKGTSLQVSGSQMELEYDTGSFNFPPAAAGINSPITVFILEDMTASVEGDISLV